MRVLRRIAGFLARLRSGEDVLVVRQSKEQWERQFATGAWDRLTDDQPNTHRIYEDIVALCAGRGTLSVLDVGCGNGGLARLLAPHTGITYCGIDISEAAVDRARTYLPQGRFWVGDAQTPPPDLGTFDVMVFNEVLYYVHTTHTLRAYRAYATSTTILFLSIFRFWRSPFVWQRVRREVTVERRWQVRDATHVWDVVTGRFR